MASASRAARTGSRALASRALKAANLALPTRSRVPFELAVFALAAAALVAAGRPVLGAVYGALVVVNAALLYAFDQVEA